MRHITNEEQTTLLTLIEEAIDAHNECEELESWTEEDEELMQDTFGMWYSDDERDPFDFDKSDLPF